MPVAVYLLVETLTFSNWVMLILKNLSANLL